MIEVTVKWRTRNFAPSPSFNVRYGSFADISERIGCPLYILKADMLSVGIDVR